MVQITDIEDKLIKLYSDITSSKDGAFRNMSYNGDNVKAFNEAFPEYEKVLFEYMCRIKKAPGEHIPLPPFIVFPTYTPVTMGWRMGFGEDYVYIWTEAIRSLSKPDELEAYCSQYDYPMWWCDYSRPRYSELPWRNKEEILKC